MELPCDPSDFCLVCRILPPDKEVIFCDSCDGHWHMKCLRQPLLEVPEGDWYCPECLQLPKAEIAKRKKRLESLGVVDQEEFLVRKIKQIQSHPHLNEKEKAKIFQDLMQETRGSGDDQGSPGKAVPGLPVKVSSQKQKGKSTQEQENTEFYQVFRSQLSCEICHQFPVFIVTTPCGHTFCGVCVQHLKTCTTCYSPLPLARTQACTDPNSYPRTNFVLECAIRLAKYGVVADPIQPGVSNDERPDKAFTTSNAKLPGLANACSGRIYATVPDHYLGPITAEYDVNKRGVRVGDTWENRLALRQSGAHRPHVTAFAGTVETGCPSIVLSKGYSFDIDNGDYFICTGCGGCDLSNNKRTGKLAFDQTFIRANQAMRESCVRGYPVRVIRSHKIMQSKFKPHNGLRYDGIYRIEMCWRFMLDEGIRVCRFLFVRCDNEPAIWKRTKDGGDKPRKLPAVEELKRATDITKRSAAPHWDFQAGAWGWRLENPSFKSKPAPEIERFVVDKDMSLHRRILRDFQCGICAKEMLQPIAAPCGHMFCKPCLEGHFNKLIPFQNPNGISTMHRRERKSVQRCPKCNATFADVYFEVNSQLKNVVEGLLQTKDIKSEGLTPSPAVDLKGPEADITEASQSIRVAGDSGEVALEKRKVVEDKQQRKRGVRLNLILALANPTLLSKKQKSRKRLGADLSEESKGTTLASVQDIGAPDAERAVTTVADGAEDEHGRPSASAGQDQDFPGSNSEQSDSAVRHYKRRKKGELPLLSGGSGSKRSCDLVSVSEGSDAQRAGSHSEAETSSAHKRRKIEYDQEGNTISLQDVEVEVEYAEKADKALRIEEVAVEYADNVGKAGSAPKPGKVEALLTKMETGSECVAISPKSDASKGGKGLTGGQVDKEPPALGASKACTLEESPPCGSESGNEDPKGNGTEMCTVNVEVVEHPKGLHGAIEVGVCPPDELIRADEAPHHDKKGTSQVHLATIQERGGLAGDGVPCLQTPADKFCTQIQSLARQESPREQNWGFLARCMRDFRQSWSVGRMGRLAQNLAPSIRK